MLKKLYCLIWCMLPIGAFGVMPPNTNGVCDAGYWFDPALSGTSALCHRCARYGDGYTSDGGTGGRETCYTTCGDGTRVYWPHTCDADKCASGAYMHNDQCTICPVEHYCPGDNTKIDCHTIITPEFPNPFRVYVLLSGSSYTREGASEIKDCFCGWRRECTDGSCKTYEAYARCNQGPGDEFRIKPDQCNNGFYASDFIDLNNNWYARCVPCTGLPENAEFSSYGTPDANGENGDNCPWRCNSGLGRTSMDTCMPLCNAGVTTLNVGQNNIAQISVPLFAAANTQPAIHIRHNDTVCHIDLTPGKQSGTINVMYNGIVYHTSHNP